MEYTHVTLNDILPQQRKNRGGGGCRKRRRALKKSPRALKSNTAGFEKKAAGFGNRHGGLCDETPQASEAGTLPVMSESLPVSRCACVVSPKAYLLPGLRVWFHQKFTRHPELCPVRLRCAVPSLQPNLSPHRIYFRAVSTFRNVLQTELLRTRTNPDGASYKTFTCILVVIINYHYEWCCFSLIEEAFRRFFRFLKTPKRQKVTMSPFFCHFSWR
ncbi:hypothetical protein IX340_000463 [Bacteroides pyogenes]|nr:hypothetical protein [Bacteroides pyogenes]